MVFKIVNNRVSNKFKTFICVLLLALAVSGADVQLSTKDPSREDPSFMGSLLQRFEDIRGNIANLNSRFLQAVEVSADDAKTNNDNYTEDTRTKAHQSWMHKTIEGLGYSFLFILLSEIGDKTFLFVVLYATRMNGLKLLLISSFALCGMHVVGVAVGGLFQYIFTPFWLQLITVVSFFIFGVALVYAGITEKEEHKQFEEKIHEVEIELMDHKSEKALSDIEAEGLVSEKQTSENCDKGNFITSAVKFFVFSEALKIIATIICTEMGDRSQVSAVALAAIYEFWIVAFAGSLGHIAALILAILFGRAVSDYTSEKCINITGGIFFLIFCAYSIFIYYILEADVSN